MMFNWERQRPSSQGDRARVGDLGVGSWKLVLVAAIVGTAACNKQAAEETETETVVPVKTAATGSIRVCCTRPASSIPRRTPSLIVIAPSARITEIPKAEGERVANGDVLVRFEIPSLIAEVQRQAGNPARQAALANARRIRSGRRAVPARHRRAQGRRRCRSGGGGLGGRAVGRLKRRAPRSPRPRRARRSAPRSPASSRSGSTILVTSWRRRRATRFCASSIHGACRSSRPFHSATLPASSLGRPRG